VRGDGQPHVTPLPAIWLDGALHFCAGSHEQKAKNLQANPGCVLAAGANQFRTGLDVPGIVGSLLDLVLHREAAQQPLTQRDHPCASVAA
jgi:hypothetical protein